MSRVPALEGGRRVGEWTKYTYRAKIPSTLAASSPLQKDGSLSRFAQQPPKRRLDLDRLTTFCYFAFWRGLRLTKPRRAESICALRRSCGDSLRASPLRRRLARFAAPAATSCALRRFSGDEDRASEDTALTEGAAAPPDSQSKRH